ncbi:MAG: hypothetical protein AB8B77_03600 [Alphaproteobacteria bacterium]
MVAMIKLLFVCFMFCVQTPRRLLHRTGDGALVLCFAFKRHAGFYIALAMARSRACFMLCVQTPYFYTIGAFTPNWRWRAVKKAHKRGPPLMRRKPAWRLNAI